MQKITLYLSINIKVYIIKVYIKYNVQNISFLKSFTTKPSQQMLLKSSSPTAMYVKRRGNVPRLQVLLSSLFFPANLTLVVKLILLTCSHPHKASSSESWFTSVTSQSLLSWGLCLPRELLNSPLNCWIYSSSLVHQPSFIVTTAQNPHYLLSLLWWW